MHHPPICTAAGNELLKNEIIQQPFSQEWSVFAAAPKHLPAAFQVHQRWWPLSPDRVSVGHCECRKDRADRIRRQCPIEVLQVLRAGINAKDDTHSCTKAGTESDAVSTIRLAVNLRHHEGRALCKPHTNAVSEAIILKPDNLSRLDGRTNLHFCARCWPDQHNCCLY